MSMIQSLGIQPVDNPGLREQVQRRLDDLTKPPGSLGMLEDLVLRYCLCSGMAQPSIDRKALCVFAADHGITAEGVSPYPAEVTAQMVENMLRGGAAVAVMCRHAGVAYRVVDMGVKADLTPHERLIDRKIAPGTASFLNGYAMSEQQVRSALEAGIALGKEEHCSVAGVGEMGIGNTSSASALCALLLDKSGKETAGAGTGTSGPALERKRHVIDAAVGFHRKQWDGTAEDALRRVGGFEIAGMTGYILGCAAGRIPVVIDGFIATASALCAMKTSPHVKDYLFFGHVSDEHFHRAVLDAVEARPVLDLGMRLGEGTGAILGMQVIEQALHCYREMATFSSAGVSNRGA